MLEFHAYSSFQWFTYSYCFKSLKSKIGSFLRLETVACRSITFKNNKLNIIFKYYYKYICIYVLSGSHISVLLISRFWILTRAKNQWSFLLLLEMLLICDYGILVFVLGQAWWSFPFIIGMLLMSEDFTELLWRYIALFGIKLVKSSGVVSKKKKKSSGVPIFYM